MPNQGLSWYKGNTKRLTVTVTDSNTGAPVVLTGSSIHCVLVNKTTHAILVEKSVGLGITIAGSTFVVSIAAADTVVLATGSYQLQAKVTLAGGDIATVLDSVVTLKDEWA